MSIGVVGTYAPLPGRQAAEFVMTITCNCAQLALLMFESMFVLENSTRTQKNSHRKALTLHRAVLVDCRQLAQLARDQEDSCSILSDTLRMSTSIAVNKRLCSCEFVRARKGW